MHLEPDILIGEIIMISNWVCYIREFGMVYNDVCSDKWDCTLRERLHPGMIWQMLSPLATNKLSFPIGFCEDTRTHGDDNKFIKKKCKNFLYSFGSPSLKFHFMYTNLNMVFYKFIMAGRKSHPPKGRQEIPVGIASSPRPKLPSKSGWAIYCEPTGVRV